MAATYYSQILARWDWPTVVGDTRLDAASHDDRDSLCVEGCDGDGHTGSAFIGTVLSNYPSGKIWMPWTTNQTVRDMEQDTAFSAALDKVASKFGGYIESGEGDPNDLYFCRYWPNDELSAS